jgi:hypothetical protein
MTTKEKFEKLIKHYANGNKSAFSNMISVNPTVVENLVGKREGNPSFDVLQKTIFTFANLNPEWLLTGKGKMLRQPDADAEVGADKGAQQLMSDNDFDMIKRIGKFIETQKISVRSFEKKISASDGMIRRAITNNTDIQSKWIAKIAANYPQLNIEWLITGKGSMFNQHANNESNDGYKDKYFEVLEKYAATLEELHALQKKHARDPVDVAKAGAG